MSKKNFMVWAFALVVSVGVLYAGAAAEKDPAYAAEDPLYAASVDPVWDAHPVLRLDPASDAKIVEKEVYGELICIQSTTNSEGTWIQVYHKASEHTGWVLEDELQNFRTDSASRFVNSISLEYGNNADEIGEILGEMDIYEDIPFDEEMYVEYTGMADYGTEIEAMELCEIGYIFGEGASLYFQVFRYLGSKTRMLHSFTADGKGMKVGGLECLNKKYTKWYVKKMFSDAEIQEEYENTGDEDVDTILQGIGIYDSVWRIAAENANIYIAFNKAGIVSGVKVIFIISVG